MIDKDIAIITSLFETTICIECINIPEDKMPKCCIKLSPCKIVDGNNFYISCDNLKKVFDSNHK